MSLDQIISNKPKPQKKPKKVAPVKASRSAKPKQIKQPFPQDSGKKKVQKERKQSNGSIFDRLGNNSGNSGGSGTMVTISNLNKDITPRDIAELCRRNGETKRVDMKFDSVGQSLGMAEVTFARQSDAINCVKQFHGVTLDGSVMRVTLGGAGGKENPTNAIIHKQKNVREGLFGTANRDDTSFSVTMGGGRDRTVKVVQPTFGNKGDRNSGKNRNDSRKGNRGNNKNKNGSRGAGNSKKPTTLAELDADMDSYMGVKSAGGKTASDLDADMDAYFAAK